MKKLLVRMLLFRKRESYYDTFRIRRIDYVVDIYPYSKKKDIERMQLAIQLEESSFNRSLTGNYMIRPKRRRLLHSRLFRRT